MPNPESIQDNPPPDAAPPDAASATHAPNGPNGAGDSAAQNEVLDRIVQGAHDTIDRLAERAAPHVQRLQQGVHNANDKLHRGADEVLRSRDEWTESLRSTVREHPLAALATALAVGVLITRLTR